MTASDHGTPCWYELSTSDIAGARAFYATILGWNVADAGMPGMDYRLGSMGDAMVSGMMQGEPGTPVAWTIYFAVTNADATFAQAISLGASPVVPPADIPGTGRFSIFLDPQGAAVGILQPLPMEDGSIGGAFDQQKDGHGNWHELLSPDPTAALAFYAKLFGWALSRSVEMGPDMTYHIFNHDGLDLGGLFAAGTTAMWKPYFGTASAKASIETLKSIGGTFVRGPDEVPGGAFTVQLTDPHGSALALVGPA